MEWWSLPQEQPPRILMVVPAWFARYRPRNGFSDMEKLSHEPPDTMLAAYMPACMAKQLQWHGDRLDAAATIVAWMGEHGYLVTFAAYIAELEVEIVEASLSADMEA